MKFLDKLSDNGLKTAGVFAFLAGLGLSIVSTVIGEEQGKRNLRKLEDTIKAETRAQVQREWDEMEKMNHH